LKLLISAQARVGSRYCEAAKAPCQSKISTQSAGFRASRQSVIFLHLFTGKQPEDSRQIYGKSKTIATPRITNRYASWRLHPLFSGQKPVNLPLSKIHWPFMLTHSG
jgi:hypothetical protein